MSTRILFRQLPDEMRKVCEAVIDTTGDKKCNMVMRIVETDKELDTAQARIVDLEEALKGNRKVLENGRILNMQSITEITKLEARCERMEKVIAAVGKTKLNSVYHGGTDLYKAWDGYHGD